MSNTNVSAPRIRAAIFDYDGTLLDSMKMWHTIPSSYARQQGKEPVMEFDEQAKYLSLDESAAEFQKMYGLTYSIEEICQQVQDMVYNFYKDELPMKPGALEILEDLHANGVRMCICTMTPAAMILAANERLGISKYFEAVYSCSDYGIGKDTPEIYHMAAEDFGIDPSEVAVFEDMVVAVETAQKAGYYTVGVWEDENRKDWERVKASADLVLNDYSEWPGVQDLPEK